MTWYASSTNRTTADATHAEPVIFCDLSLDSGHVRLHTRTGTLQIGGNDYLGIGKLGQVSTVSEDAELRPSAVTLTLSGVDTDLMTAATAEEYHGRPCTVYLGLLDPNTLTLVATPETWFEGTIDVMSCALGDKSGTIVLTGEHELARWERHSNGLYTNESQQTYYASDRFFDQIPFIQNRTITWADQTGGWGDRARPRPKNPRGI